MVSLEECYPENDRVSAMAEKKKSYVRAELFHKVESYAEKIQSVEEEIRLIIQHLRLRWDGLSKEEKASKMGLQLQRDIYLLNLISLRLSGAGVMLNEFPKDKSKTDSIARDF